MDKLVNQVMHAVHHTSMARPPKPDDALSGGETKVFAKARCSNLQETEATACLRVRPTYSLRVVPAEFVAIRRRFIGVEEHVAMKYQCSDAVDVDIQYARICPGAGAQVKQHQPLLHAISGRLKWLGAPSGEQRTVHCTK